MKHLQDKTVIITGASRGIGAATAQFIASQGGNVVLAARSGAEITELAKDISAQGGKALAQTCDVARFADMAALAEQARSTFGGIDVLINNAGLIDPIAHLADSDPEEWRRVMDVNVTGVYNGARAVLPDMLKAGGGTILNISSGAATSPLEGWSHYCASKAAVLMLTRCLDKEYGSQGIRALGLSPGTVATNMQVAIKASGINPVSQLDPAVHIPPEWVARAIGFLCGPGGDAYKGADFSLKTDEGRAQVGLPPVS